MRAVLCSVLLSACAGSSRPAVIPKLSELPADPQRRDAVLDSAHHEPTPEQHAPLTKKERKAETVAATAAALIGSILSDSENVTLGVGTPIDFGHTNPQVRPSESDSTVEHERRHEAAEARRLGEGLPVDVPWVRLK